MEPNIFWLWAVEKESLGCILNICPQLFPSVALRENIFREALSRIAAFGFLGDFENQFANMNRQHGSSFEAA